MSTAIPAAALAQHIAILGKTGSGKTTTAKLAIEQVVAEGARVCVLDPIKSDWWGLISSADGKRPGLPFHILGGPRGHVPLHSSAGKAIAEIVANGTLPLSIIDMADFAPGGQAHFFVDFAPALIRKMRGVVYLVIEEAHLFAPKERSGVGAENLSIHWAKTLATAGRSKGVRLILLTQRTQALHNALLGSCDTIIAHRLTAPADQDPVLKWLKANVPPEIRDQVAGSMASLKTGHAWLCSGEARIFERVEFPRPRTYDNTATPEGDGELQTVKTAAVDHEKLRAIIGDAVKDAEASDPKLLRDRIAKLERELAAKKPPAPAPPDHEAIAAAYSDGFEACAKAAAAGVLKLVDQNETMIDAIETLAKSLADPPPPPFKRSGTSPARARTAGFTVHRQTVGKPRDDAKARPHPVNQVEISQPQQRLLDSLAWLESKGLHPAPKNTLAAVAHVSPTSGGYFNNLGFLRSAGFIEYPTPGAVGFTTDGRAASNSPEDDGSEVHEHWLKIVSAPQAAILNALIKRHPETIHKDELAREIKVSETSGGYFNNLGSLRTLGAIDYPQRGFVGLTRYVMPDR